MKEYYSTEPTDNGLVIKLKKEANILLASLNEGGVQFVNKKDSIDAVIKFFKAIGDTDPQCQEDIDDIFNIANTIWTKGILSPLRLTDDEFEKQPNSFGYRVNSRLDDILLKNKKIYVCGAIKCLIRHTYVSSLMQEIEPKDYIQPRFPRIYINKGGIINGDYIDGFIIRSEQVAKHCYTIQSTVKLPVSRIITDLGEILTVDHREPKLKVLECFYELQKGHDDNVNGKGIYNIRNYKKLK